MRVKADHTVVIERPREEVFEYLTNVDNLPEWQSSVLEARKTTEGPVGTGTSFTEVRKFLGRRLESRLEVTEYEPPERFVLRVVEGPVPFDVRHTLRSANGGTALEVSIEGDPGGFFKVAAPLVAMQGKRQLESDFGAMKTLLEARGETS